MGEATQVDRRRAAYSASPSPFPSLAFASWPRHEPKLGPLVLQRGRTDGVLEQGEPATFEALHGVDGAGAVADLPAVVLVLELGRVAVQVAGRDVMMGPVDLALEVTEVP